MPAKHVNNNPNWTAERIQYLRDNYRIMLVADIVKTFNELFTRNAIIAKARRLGLYSDHRMRPARRGPRGSPITTLKSKFSPRSSIIVNEIRMKILKRDVAPVSIVGLEGWHCREIVQEKPGILYCGKPKIGGSSYCLEHHSKNHVRMANSRVEKYYGL